MKRVTPEEWRAESVRGPVAVDFETFYSGEYSVSEMGAWAYVHDPRFHCYLVAVCDGERVCACAPEAFPWVTLDGADWVSHNRGFDQAVFERLVELGVVPCVRWSRWWCTAALMAYLQHPRDLAGAALSALGRTLDKTPRARACGVAGGTQGVFDLGGELHAYAGTDAEVCWLLWDRFGDFWPAHERALEAATLAMGRRGLCVDWAYVTGRRVHADRLAETLTAALPFRPALSRKQFDAACDAEGVPRPPTMAEKAGEYQDWLKAHAGTLAATRAATMARLRKVRRLRSVLDAMLLRRMADGRLCYELKYCGATTGRWSGGGGLNPQNPNRKETEGVNLRGAICAPPGHVLGVLDYASIEHRVLLWLAGDDETLDAFRRDPDADAYEVHARGAMGWTPDRPGESLEAYCARTGSSLRQYAKARVLGLGFGCGRVGFVTAARTLAGLTISENEAAEIVRDFRNKARPVVRLWERLEEAAYASAGRDYLLPLPVMSAFPHVWRALVYRGVNVARGVIEATIAGERCRIYGGLLAENWTQATARDVLASAWLRCIDAGLVPVMSTHDELVFEFPADRADELLARAQSIMEQAPPWAAGLPLRAKGRCMARYGK